MGALAAAGRLPADAGVSLVEMLVVLSLVAILAGTGLLAVSSSRSAAPREAENLARRLTLAADLALVSGAPFALRWEVDRYAFFQFDLASGEWVPPRGVLGPLRDLPSPLRLVGDEARASGRLILWADPTASAVELTLLGGPTPWTVRFDGLAATARPVAP